ncbi:IS110 family transposase [Lentisalinibacter sediminis]|uniref:IS110 family transposase n=1 Tax=Lentisalinibacter sediminis TaxID=2992237 RepID=UPI00386CD3DD
MAKEVAEITLGVDVSKDTLVIYDWDSGELNELANDPESIQGWLRGLAGPVRLAVEPTSSYHLAIVEAAQRRGYTVYLVNPRQLAHYREAVNARNKTDPADAWLLARYLAHEGGQLRPFEPASGQARQLWALLSRRAVVVQSRNQLTQSFREVGFSARGLMNEIRRILKRLDERLLALVRALGWEGDYRRALSIPGIGPLNAVALVATFHRGAFASADAFVAYLGLDVRIRESGMYEGKRKLTKRGPAELRRLLYCAAKPARTYAPFADYHQRQLDKGLSKIAANCILARKLARIAFTLINRQQTFQKQEIAYSQAP